jgi:RimJ/RimL family protein N-acetyltransferase
MVRWSYHDGSTWATILTQGTSGRASEIIGWSVFTRQEDRHPIIGTFVDPAHRGLGHGTELVKRLLAACSDQVPYGTIYAVGDWWAQYPKLITEAGFRHVEWG